MQKKYTLIIVDDLFVERESARDIIEQSDLPIEIIGEFENGKQAITYLTEHTVDMILADIEMPIIDGLAMQQQLKELEIESDIIFFSLYNRFEYVQKALKLGAFGYVIKPIEPDELIQAFRRLLERKKRLETEQFRLDGLRDQLERAKPLLINTFLKELLLHPNDKGEELKEQLEFHNLSIKENDQFSVAVLEVDGYQKRTAGYAFTEKELFKLQIEEGIRTILSPYGILYIRLEAGQWAFLSTARMLEDAGPNSLYDIFEQLMEMLQDQEISVSCIISRFADGIESIPDSFKLAREAMHYKFSLGYGQLIDAAEFDLNTTSRDIDFQELQKEVNRIVQTGNGAEVRSYLHAVFDTGSQSMSRNSIKKTAFSLINALQLSLNELNLTVDNVYGPSSILQDRLHPFETIGKVAEEMILIFQTACDHIAANDDNNSLVVRRARSFIEEHYPEQITVQEVSDAVFYSPNYLNTLFRRQTGKSLLEYLTKVRIDKAKKLLQEPNTRIYRVSEAVGYSQESYFRTVFKRQTGMSPKEYMKKLGV